MIELILGGARSGKSTMAVERARASGQRVAFIATAQALDDEMRERIEHHRVERPLDWTTIEAPLQLANALRQVPSATFVIVDCLTLWITNVLFPAAGNALAAEAAWARESAALLDCLPRLHNNVVLVSNEVGLGIVPESAVGRRFRDEQGRLNQRVASVCHRVTFVAAGLPITLKATP